MLRVKYKVKAFTLVELLVAISIALLLMAAGGYIVSKNSGMSKLNSDTELLSTYIARARNLAANPDDPDALGYGVQSASSDASRFEIFRRLPSTAPSGWANTVIDSMSLTGSMLDPALSVFFASPSGTYSTSTLPQPYTLKLIKKPTTSRIIQIDPPGVVNAQ